MSKKMETTTPLSNHNSNKGLSKLPISTKAVQGFKRPKDLSDCSPTETIIKQPKLDQNQCPRALWRSKSVFDIPKAKPRMQSSLEKRATLKPAIIGGSVMNLHKSSSFANPTAAKASTSTFVKPEAIVPGKKGKRPAWDLKGRVQDTEEALKGAKLDNEKLMEMLQNNEERLVRLESTNTQLTDLVQVKDTVTKEFETKIEDLGNDIVSKEREIARLMADKQSSEQHLQLLETKLSAEMQKNNALESTVVHLKAMNANLQMELSANQIRINEVLKKLTETETILKLQKEENSLLCQTLSEKNDKLGAAEILQRKLHNTIQELKGNIRVFCRMRPMLPSEKPFSSCSNFTINFPCGEKKIEIQKLRDDKGHESSSIKGGPANYEFAFDRVFPPSATQLDVFNEISQLVQSALDGYNVCVFAYGQTGSGKTYTMEGPEVVDTTHAGMISRTIEQVFEKIDSLKCIGWTYSVSASFLEVYNESLRDLLGKEKENVKHEIKMDDSKGVYVTNVNIVQLQSKSQVLQLVQQAREKRAKAATNCNERSSRSHSVFQLFIKGQNVSSESCVGTLNLVDLAGSERLKASCSDGERLKETKYINKSLSNLGNVIMALAQKTDHIPYRNSKLTHLLMNSLGGNSKTLMFVNVSPKDDHMQETLNALRFATKVNQCHIGTAQRKLM